jgi:hypothetical protein
MPVDRSASSTFSAERDLVSHAIKLRMARHMLQDARRFVPNARPILVTLQQLCTARKYPQNTGSVCTAKQREEHACMAELADALQFHRYAVQGVCE